MFDLAIIGGGSAAFAAAIRTSELGGRAAIINDGLPIGGTCVNVGCVPSKAFIRAAEAHHRAQNVPHSGIVATSRMADYGAVSRGVQDLVSSLQQSKYVDVVRGDANVEIIHGHGRFVDATTVDVDGHAEPIRARRVLIATGARTWFPDVPGLRPKDLAASNRVLTNETLYALQELPEHVVVLGGRYVALENAQWLARMGAKVTILQRSERILPGEMADVTDELTTHLSAEGIRVETGIDLGRVEEDARGVRIHTNKDVFDGSHVLVALGRQGNTENLGLDALAGESASNGRGVALHGRGFVRADNTLQTSVPGVFAAGDVLGGRMFVYTAAYEGRLAAENAMQDMHKRVDYTALPWVVFTDPQVAGVGLDERQAEAEGIRVDTAVVPLKHVPRAQAARDMRGFIKLIRNADTDQLVGARIVAPEGGELVMEVALGIQMGVTVDRLASMLHPYLTLSEGIKLAAITFGKDVEKLSCCAV